MADLSLLVPSLAGVGVLMAVSTLALVLFRVPAAWSPVVAIARGALQLAVISVILAGIITSPMWIAVALVVMYAAAVAVAVGRIGWSTGAVVTMSAAIAAGVLVATGTVFVTGALELSPRFALAIGAIVIGNTMSVAVMTARQFTDAVVDHWDEVEGWLAIGATPRQSTRGLARRAVRNALIPSIDQTKTTGLVVLPGAFVGAIFGGLSPLDAGRFQIVVLAAIMAAGSVTAVLIAVRIGAVRTKPVASR